MKVMEDNIQYLFVYGSLHSGFKNPAYEYLSQHFELIGAAVAQGSLFHNEKYPIAIATTDDHIIKGELYKIKKMEEFEWVIAQLDDYEGLNVMPGETSLYKRSITEVNTGSGTVAAWVYWYNGSIDGLSRILSGDVFDFFKQ